MSSRPPLKDAPIVTVARALAERQLFGLVWFDRDCVITARYGQLVDFVDVGAPLTEAIPALVGLEGELAALPETGSIFRMPAISIIGETGQTPRLDLQAMYLKSEDTLLCILSRTTVGSDLELELSKEIRRRLMAESKTAEALRELERANRDLEDFAGMISHDLQSPLRALRYDLEALEALLTQGELAAGLETTAVLKSKVHRISSMMSALLDYASRSQTQDAREVVDTAKLIDDIVSSLPIPPGFEVVTTGEWPSVETVRSPLDGVLRNLIDNAIKHHDRPAGQVELHAEPKEGALVFAVSDDGPGIEAARRQACFLPFRTFNPEHISPGLEGKDRGGTGMGLAYVKRMVDGVGGTIEVAGRRDGRRGARFQVRWPIGEAASCAT